MRRMSPSLKYYILFVLLTVLTVASPQQRNRQRGNKNSRVTAGNRNPVTSTATQPVITPEEKTENDEKFCDEPPTTINDAKLVSEEQSEYSVGTVIRYACDTEFSYDDDGETSECELSENGVPEWTVPNIKCIPINCGDPGSVKNSQRVVSAFTLNGRITYKCNDGYVLIGKETIECSSNGFWTENLPSCKNKTSIDLCDKPPSLNGLKIITGVHQNYPVGSVITYTCDFGYVSDTVSANSNCAYSSRKQIGEWTPPDIHCSPRSCGDPGVMLNGHRSGSLFTIGNKVTYECDDGYYVKGFDTRFCMVSGLWSGELGTCEKMTCPIPNDPNNGKAIYMSLEYGAEIEYECDSGFSLASTENRICTVNGTWSGDEPLCKETSQCEPLDAPKHGNLIYVTSTQTKVGSIAVFTCESGYTLIGSTTTKCFVDIGWTFPTPKCAEKCSVPEVEHGEIHELKLNYYRKESLNKVSVGTAIDASKEYYLICGHQYEPMGETKGRAKISCINGEWSKTPECLPAKCKLNPPATKHGTIRQPLQRNHNKVVVYDCNANFHKTKTGNVTCRYGQWIGTTPTCEDSRCYLSKLGFAGLIHGHRKVYNHGESFFPSCEERYAVSELNINFTCQSGEWDGPYPPCVPANCSQYPPSTPFGSANPFHVLHTSEVSYTCDEWYIQTTESSVQCDFGEWKGKPPVCKDSRCYLKDINENYGINTSESDLVLSGDHLGFVCADGFDYTGSKVLCTEGEWKFQNGSPCKAKNCQVQAINFGKFTKKIPYGNHFQNKQMNIGEIVEHSVKTFVTCDASFSLEGRLAREGQVTCMFGQWSPPPICSKSGTVQNRQDGAEHEDIKRPRNSTANVQFKNDQEQKLQKQNWQSLSTTAIFQTITSLVDSVLEIKSKKDDNNCCKYENRNDRVIAHVGSELLRTGGSVQKGLRVKFYCNRFGYDRLLGPSEIECKYCKPWRNVELPKCEPPQWGDSVIRLVRGIEILPGGTLAIKAQSNARMACYFKDAYDYQPRWGGPDSPNIQQRAAVSENGIPVSVLDINNAHSGQSGKYTCYPYPNKKKMEVHIEVLDHISCQKFQDDGIVIAHYDNGLQVNSNVFFTCKDPTLKVAGRDLLTCLKNGTWSGNRPRCVVMCPKLSTTEGMNQVTYSKDQEVGSIASFHCIYPRVLSLDNFSLSCLINGEWSGEVPMCSFPPCRVQTLPGVLPDDVTYDDSQNTAKSEYPIGNSLRLKCKNENLTLSGTPFARCNEDSKWEVEEDIKCQTGCLKMITQDSKLKIDPSKEFYNIGELVTLSCPPGKKIRNDIQQLMCHIDGWSHTMLDCMDSE